MKKSLFLPLLCLGVLGLPTSALAHHEHTIDSSNLSVRTMSAPLLIAIAATGLAGAGVFVARRKR